MVIVSVAREDVLQMALPQNDHVIQALPTYRTDDPFGIGILPGRARCRQHLRYSKRFALAAKSLTVDGISIAKQVSRSLVHSIRFHELPRRPAGCRMGCDVEMKNPSPVVSQNDEHEQHPERGGRHRKEIECDEL